MQVRALQVLRMGRTSVQQRVGARTFAKSFTKTAGLSVARHGTPVRSIAGAVFATSHVQKI